MVWWKERTRDFMYLRRLVWAAFLLTYASFFFSVKNPSSHTFYLLFPLVMVYAFACLQGFFKNKIFTRSAAAIMVCGLVFHAVLGIDNCKRRSLYTDRARVVTAILEKNCAVVGELRGK
jgi:uncharacterized membrane protein